MPIIVLNAPPAAGKDTIAGILSKRWGFKKLEFKQRIYDIAKVVLGESLYINLRLDLHNRAAKEAPQDYLGGLSPREFLIKISEDWVKPVFGDDYFGVAAGQAVQKDPSQVYVFSDGGFDDELAALRETTDTPIVLVRLYRDGYSFAGDSRNYLRNGIAHATIELELFEGDPELNAEQIVSYIDFIKDQEGN